MLLITGGAGFIGSHLLSALKKDGLEMKAIVRGHIPQTLQPEDCISANILDASEIHGVSGEFETVVHLAGGYDAELNVGGTKNVLSACKSWGTRRFIYMSSLDVFMSPETAYAKSKAAAEAAVRASGLEYSIIRPSMVYGTGDGLISPLIERIKSQSFVPVPGGGDILRRPLYVEDLITEMVPIICGSASPASLNVAGEDAMSIKAMCGAIEKLLGVRRNYISVPAILFRIAGVVSARMRFIGENILHKIEVGTREKVLYGNTSLEDGLRKMLELSP